MRHAPHPADSEEDREHHEFPKFRTVGKRNDDSSWEAWQWHCGDAHRMRKAVRPAGSIVPVRGRTTLRFASKLSLGWIAHRTRLRNISKPLKGKLRFAFKGFVVDRHKSESRLERAPFIIVQ